MKGCSSFSKTNGAKLAKYLFGVSDL